MSEDSKKFDPSWKREYPIAQKAEHRCSRRSFSKTLAISAIAVGGGVALKDRLLGTEREGPKMEIASIDELGVGDYKLFQYPSDQPCILIRITESEYVAYSQSCTHLMCPIHYKSTTQQLVCPCHQGFFDAKDGTVISGPPPRALPRYKVTLADGKIIVG